MKGLLVIQNKQSLTKFEIMAQAESKMTIGKAIALWKINSGVQGIEGDLDQSYKNLNILKLVQILDKHVFRQNLLSYLAI